MPARPRVTTADEYFALPENKAIRDELLDGEYVVSPIPRLAHDLVVTGLNHRIRDALAERRDLIVVLCGSVMLDSKSVLQPDLFVVARPASVNTHWRDMELPRLVVEVLSPSTARRDRVKKRGLYQRAGVPECWIVNVDDRAVEAWRPDDIQPRIVRDTITWQPDGRGPSVTIDLQAFFRDTIDD